MNERILHLCRSSGLFHLSERLFRHRLPIFCFHVFQLEDECLFRPKLFLSEKVLRERLEWLRRRNYKVLPLDEALASLAQGKLPARAIALTIDDGFFSVLKVCAPILREFDYPATLYQTSYYAAKQTPIFRLVVQYMFWKSKAERYSQGAR